MTTGAWLFLRVGHDSEITKDGGILAEGGIVSVGGGRDFRD